MRSYVCTVPYPCIPITAISLGLRATPVQDEFLSARWPKRYHESNRNSRECGNDVCSASALGRPRPFDIDHRMLVQHHQSREWEMWLSKRPTLHVERHSPVRMGIDGPSGRYQWDRPFWRHQSRFHPTSEGFRTQLSLSSAASSMTHDIIISKHWWRLKLSIDVAGENVTEVRIP